MTTDETLKLLIIDDEERLLRILRLGLKKYQFDVMTADSAERGLDYILEKPVDLIITDVRLGGMSGIDLVYELERLQAGVPIIVMTAHADVQSAVKALKHGASDYIQKPFNVEELYKVISDVLAKVEPHEKKILPTLDEGVAETEKELILRALAQSGNVKAKAARLLNISLRTLWYKIKKYDLN